MTTWQTMDPDTYDAAIAAELVRRGFYDSSYNNDAAPSFHRDIDGLRVWLFSELSDHTFIVDSYDAEMDFCGEIAKTNDFNELLTIIGE